MKFSPLKNDQKPAKKVYPLLPEGIYEFEVLKAEEAISKSSGNPMIKVMLKCFSGNTSAIVFDYLLTTSKKLMGFCARTGIEDKYELGEITDNDCLGKKGWVKIVVDEHEKYGKRNNVAFYAWKPKDLPVDKKVNVNEEEFSEDEDLPF